MLIGLSSNEFEATMNLKLLIHEAKLPPRHIAVHRIFAVFYILA